MKIKTIHIHTDKKFLHNTKMFEGALFDNTTILLSKGTNQYTNNDILIINDNKEDFNKVVTLCNSADLVVLYDLTLAKSKIALAISKNIKIAWRFFGYELYGKKPDLYKSELTKRHDTPPATLKHFLRKNLIPIYEYIKYGNTEEGFFNKTVKRSDAFLALSQFEYSFLIKTWPNLPPFVKLPHYHLNKNIEKLDLKIKYKEDRPIIIIGNNRSSYNNHLDVINTIEKYPAKVNYNFTLLFNYGTESNYSKMVLKQVAGKDYFNPICEFIPKDEFFEFYQKPSALIIDGYRQMAGANIRLALENGTKVYLNNKNVHKQFLESEGFKLFSMEDFEEDLKNDSLHLDEAMAKHNFDMFQKFCDRYTIQDFQQELIKVLNLQ